MNTEHIEHATRQWVNKVVIDLNLCPFAQKAMAAKQVRFFVTAARTEEALLEVLQHELALLQQNPAIETSLLIHPEALRNFSDYNQFLDYADALLVAMDLEGIFQIASFHPDYQFSDTQLEDVENFTNRSPYPMLHVLREQSVEAAVCKHPAPEQIPAQNIKRLRQLGSAHMLALFDNCRNSKIP
ncbi:MAG: DUF1415 domain-containing protein [Bacteroidota bacterium]